MNSSLYKKYSSLIDRKELKETHRELSYLYNVVDRLHELVPDATLSCDEVETSFWTQYPDASHDIYDGLLQDLRAVELSEQVGDVLMAQMTRRKDALRLSEASYELSQGRGSLEEVRRLTEALKDSSPEFLKDEFEVLSVRLTELVREEKQTPGFKWRLNCFNLSLGPLRKGVLGHIFARVETGKSAMWISEVAYMLPQIPEGQTCVICFNEEGGRDIIYRLYSAVLGKTYQQCIENPEQSEKEFLAKGGDKIVFIDRPVLHRNEMERIFERYKPALIVIDNLDKVKGFEADRNDLVLAAIYKWARTMAKTYAPVLSVGQADVSANNSKWLTEAQMADSKTGKPAELDFIIGIGRVDTEGFEYVRYISIPKNKLRGDENTNEHFRHGRFETLLKSEYSIYRDIGELASK